jgi:hypothetical protein
MNENNKEKTNPEYLPVFKNSIHDTGDIRTKKGVKDPL